jgi:release factor H-coupled RctB family protein
VLEPCADLRALELARGLGTVGGGNHFAEISVVDQLLDSEHCSRLHIKTGQLAVLVHSGSRGLGARVAEHFAASSLLEAEAGPFLAAQRWACRFARANRLLLSHQLLALAGADRLTKHVLTVDSTHNEVVRLDTARGPLWVHRKGAAPASAGELTLLLGSRGAASFLMLGLGSEQSLCTMAHGAGRRYSRADALAKMRAKHTRASLSRTALGSRVLCERTELLYEEHPDVYKPLAPILDCLSAARVAQPLARLRPLLTVKA